MYSLILQQIQALSHTGYNLAVIAASAREGEEIRRQHWKYLVKRYKTYDREGKPLLTGHLNCIKFKKTRTSYFSAFQIHKLGALDAIILIEDRVYTEVDKDIVNTLVTAKNANNGKYKKLLKKRGRTYRRWPNLFEPWNLPDPLEK